MLDTHGVQTNSFRCADCMQIELEFNLDEPVDRPLIPTRCATSTAKSYSGPTRSSWALRFQGLPLGVTSIASSRHSSIQPQNYLLSVGLAYLDSAGSVVLIHRMHCQGRITVIGGDSQGTAWCSTRIAMTCRSDPDAMPTPKVIREADTETQRQAEAVSLAEGSRSDGKQEAAASPCHPTSNSRASGRRTRPNDHFMEER